MARFKYSTFCWQDRGAFIPLFLRAMHRRAASALGLTEAELSEIAEATANWLETNVEIGSELALHFRVRERPHAPKEVDVIVKEPRKQKRGFETKIYDWVEKDTFSLTLQVEDSN
jgi:hypothetical protein